MPRLDRIRGLMLLIAALLSVVVTSPVAAQQPGRARQIGVLSPFVGPDSGFLETIRQRLQELGHIEGRHVTYVYRAAESFDQLARLATELVRLRVDVIVTAGPQGVRAAREATTTIPIVIANVGDAVAQGFVSSLARPGGNVTGLSSLNTELSAKRVEMLRQVLPGVSHVVLLREAVGDANPVRASETAARALGMRVEVLQVRESDELPSAFAAITATRGTALGVLPGSMFTSRLRRIVELAAAGRLPAIYPDSRYVLAGGLMSYGPNITDLYRRAAGYVDRILKGASAGDLPVEQPTTIELAINVRTAGTLGITVPPAVLARADVVVP
jgi:ABC-type uncharacterized transport system substrate-binding protein